MLPVSVTILSSDGDEVVDAVLVPHQGGASLLTVTQRAYGKRTSFGEYPSQNRNGKGVISIKTPDESGLVVGALEVVEDDQLMLVTDTGRIIRISVAEVSTYGRNTRGVRMMRLGPDENIVDMAKLQDPEEEESDEADENVEAAEGHEEASESNADSAEESSTDEEKQSE